MVAVGLRLWYAWDYALNIDELVSYDYMALPGPALTASYYPLPNNHLLPNLLAGAVHSLWPGASPVVALRLLPTLLGLGLLPLGLRAAAALPALRNRDAGLGAVLLSPQPLFYAVAGRGYGWTLVAFLVGLEATLQLLRPQNQPLGRAGRQRAWAAFSLSAVSGAVRRAHPSLHPAGAGPGAAAGF